MLTVTTIKARIETSKEAKAKNQVSKLLESTTR